MTVWESEYACSQVSSSMIRTAILLNNELFYKWETNVNKESNKNLHPSALVKLISSLHCHG